jgi:hypothetical protein
MKFLDVKTDYAFKEKFIYFIKHSDDLTLIPKELEDIKDALATINETTLTPEELELQLKRII